MAVHGCVGALAAAVVAVTVAVGDTSRPSAQEARSRARVAVSTEDEVRDRQGSSRADECDGRGPHSSPVPDLACRPALDADERRTTEAREPKHHLWRPRRASVPAATAEHDDD